MVIPHEIRMLSRNARNKPLTRIAGKIGQFPPKRLKLRQNHAHSPPKMSGKVVWATSTLIRNSAS